MGYELVLLERIVEKECKESPVVFYHNDATHTNLYIGRETGCTFSLLDFEHGDIIMEVLILVPFLCVYG